MGSQGNRRSRRGQSVSEYAIVFSVVAAALIGMQLFLKRGLQGKEKGVTDYYTGLTGDTLGVGNLSTIAQYEPYYTGSDYTTATSTTQTEEMKTGGKVERRGIADSTERTGSATQDVDQKADDAWQ